MKQATTETNGVNRRGFFAGLASGLGVAAVALGARKVRAAARPERPQGPVLYRRTAETERYLRTLD